MEPKSTPPPASYQHFDTPTKARIQGAIEFAKHEGVFRSKREGFEFYGVGHTRGYEIIKSDTSRRQHNTGKPDPRGRKSLLSKKDVDRIDEILQTWGFDARAMTWKQLAATAEAPSVSWRTIQRALSKSRIH